ncbi:MAG: hypothetical protein GY778_08685 [bacterium]|nr:hypothetical protein [bacterium]
MQKFFRKHMRKLLMIFMTLLLIVWLGGSALTTMLTPDRSALRQANTRFGEITVGDVGQANSLTTILARLQLPWYSPGQDMLGQGAPPLTAYEWIMLSREARELGFAVSETEGREFLQQQRGMPESQVFRFAQQWDMTPEQIYAAAAQFFSVRQAVEAVAAAAQTSEAELRIAARNAFERVSVHVVALPADALVDSEATFTDEQLNEQLGKYREQQPKQGLNFGYHLPQRAKAQYLRVDLEKVIAGLRIGESTLLRAARDHWKANREDPAYLRPPPEPDPVPTTQSTQPAESAAEDDPAAPDVADASDDESATTQPTDAADATSKPADDPPPSKYYETFTEARVAALAVIRKQKAADRAAKVAEALAQRVAEPWFDTDRGEDQYKVLPPEQDDLSFYDTAQADLPPERVYEGAVTVGTTDWFSAQDVRLLPGLGRAQLAIPGGESRRFGQLAFQVQGLADMPQRSEADTSLFLARYESCPLPLTDPDGNLYIYRMVAVEPARAPETLDEVRPAVIADLRLLKAFEEAQRLGQSLLDRAVAAEGGLKAAWEADTELQGRLGENGGFAESNPFSRERVQKFSGFSFPTYVNKVGIVARPFVDRCFELGTATDPAGRFAVIPIEDSAMVAVVQWTETLPMREDSYEVGRQQVAAGIMGLRRQQLVAQWLNPELIRSRNEFEPEKP